jgi:hypothetical protein
MPKIDTRWPPQVGDAAREKDTGLVGTVVKTKGVYEARFRLHVDPPTTDGDAVAVKRAKAMARTASRWYGLEELEPPS